MKKILITEEQMTMLNSALEHEAPQSLPPFLLNGVNDTPISSSVYKPEQYIKKLLEKRYEEIKGYFNDDITSYSESEIRSKLNKLFTVCMKKESSIKENLQNICYNKVTELFGIPSGSVEIECRLEEIPRGARFHIKPDTDESVYDSIDQMDSEDLEIKKRKLLNCISYGCAARLASGLMGSIVKEIFELDEELPHIYSKIMKINEYLVFVNNVKIEDKSHKQGGTVEVNLSDDTSVPKIKATGMILPILLQETIAGILEIVSTYGLPDSKESAKRVLNVSDALENEPWVMRLGPGMWDPIAEITGIKDEEAPYFIKELSQCRAEEFIKLFMEFTANTKAGREKIASIYNKSKYNRDYEGFENDLAAKKRENMIVDSYFTEEELMEGVTEED